MCAARSPAPVAVGTYPNVMVAEMVKDRLEAEGISAFVGDEALGTAFPGVESALGGIRVFVRAEEEVVAREVLANLSHPLGTAEVLPDESPPGAGRAEDGEESAAEVEAAAESRTDRSAHRMLLLILVGLVVVLGAALLIERTRAKTPPGQGVPPPPDRPAIPPSLPPFR